MSAVGFGAILTAVIQWALSSRSISNTRLFEARLDAYVGLLASWRDQESILNEEQNPLIVGHWVERSQLVGSKEVFELSEMWIETDPQTQNRIDITKRLKIAMRNDLKSIKL